MNERVLVTDAKERSAVAACQSLHRRGYRVGAASSESRAPAQWSRFSNYRHRIPDPRDDTEAFVREVAALVRSHDYTIVLPGSDASVLAISEHRELFDPDLALGLPSREIVGRCLSKLELTAAAADAGLAVPETVVAESPEEARRLAEQFGYPLLLKPRSTVFDADGRKLQHSSARIADRDTLDALLPDFGLPCLLQRCAAGPLLSFAGVFAEGELLGVAFSRYLRTWRPEAGSVSHSITETPSQHLRERVGDLVGSLGWQGIFELELIETAPGTYSAIDFNPRLYGSLALAVSAGAPLPALWCDSLLGRDPAPCVARAGYSYRWEDAELRNLFTYLRRGRLAAAASVVRPRRHTTKAYFRWSDPAPILVRAMDGMMRKPGSRGSKSAPLTAPRHQPG